MPPADYEREWEVALEAIRNAARLCQNVQAATTPDVLDKKDRSPVTVADFGSQAVICRALEIAFPQDPIIGEEEASVLRSSKNAGFLDRVQDELRTVELDARHEEICHWIDRANTKQFGPRFWTLDPIDGTKGFLRGGQYAISLALIIDGRIDLALLGCPNLPLSADADKPAGVILSAIRGQGSHVIPLAGDSIAQPITVSSAAEFSCARFCESVETGHTSHGVSARVAEDLGVTRSPIRMDSQAKYAIVARGEAEIYMRLPTRSDYREKIWDHAGGVLLVEEAGGQVTDVSGKPLEWTHGHELVANRGVIATNQRVHDRVLHALKRAGVN